MYYKAPDSIPGPSMTILTRDAELRDGVIGLIKALKTEADDPTTQQHCPCEMSLLNEDRVLATLDCSLGKGRLVLGWALSDQEWVGQLIVQRLTFDERDEQVWQVVWVINVPSYGPPYVVTKSGPVAVLPEHEFGRHYIDARFRLFLSILCAVCAGPQVEER